MAQWDEIKRRWVFINSFQITQMEAALKRQKSDGRRQSPRQGDWVCIYCNNYNYAFRTTCNRCRVQTRQRNDQQTALLTQQPVGAALCGVDWVQERDAENEDPIKDSWFPKVLFVTPPKSYSGRNKSLHREHRCSLNLESGALAETDPNLSKKHLRLKQEAFEKENLKWLNKIIEQ